MQAMSQMIVLDQGRAPRPTPAPTPFDAAPTTLFEVIDRAVNAVIDQLNHWEERDARDGADEAHFEAYVRWRVAIVDDAVAQALTLMAGDTLTTEGSRWRDAHARA